MKADETERPLRQKLAWFVLLWALGIAAVGSVAWVIRLFLGL
ncbi:DUF2474 family protein [Taklimakanibacter lacteus]